MSITEEAAKKWFMKAVTSLGGLASKLTAPFFTITNNKLPPVGEIILFTYNPKGAKDLEYYDIHPLILSVSFDHDHFCGINLHYIPPENRAKLIDFLLTQKKISNGQREYINRVYPMLQELSRTNMCMFAYKKYLPSHVGSKFIIVKQDYWKLVAKLPLQKFKKATDQQVWRDAKRSVMK